MRDAAERYYRLRERENSPFPQPGLAERRRRDPADQMMERRRVAVLERAEEEGVASDLAELLYDISLEEGLDPPLALELVRTGLAVAPPDEDSTPDEPIADRYVPTWVIAEEDPERLELERRLRTTFRRFRGFLETGDEVGAAFRRLADEPDVERTGY